MKTKWLKLSYPNRISHLAAALGTAQFTRTSRSGVELLDVQRELIRGKFIQEIVEHETIMDPFGAEVSNFSRRFQIFNFRIIPVSEGQFLLCAETPPRSFKEFIDFLADNLEFGFSISALVIDIALLIRQLSVELPKYRFSINRAIVGNIKLSNESIAKIQVTSNNDAFRDVATAMDLTGSSFERASLIITHDGQLYAKLDIGATAVLVGDQEFLEEISLVLQRHFFRFAS